MNTCEFFPDGGRTGKSCGQPATRIVRILRVLVGDSYYMHLCNDCLPLAEAHWGGCGVKYEL